jgi:outer membrane protein assembly factor BamA
MFHSVATPYRRYTIFVFSLLVLFITSCSTVKNYPVRKPFVYETKIEIKGKFTTDEKKQLISQLTQQLHDSIRVRSVQKLIGWDNGPRLLYSVINKPPVYDSLNADKSVTFMRALLNAQGYYRDTITYDTSIKYKGDQYRTYVNFNVHPGRLIHLDSVWYTLGNDSLQQITLQEKDASLLKKGEPFAKGLISTELDRLTDVYRNNGYLRFSREEFLAVWDTVGLALLRPTLDPLEQVQQLQALQRRRANPTADVEIRLRANPDTSRLIRYYNGDITVYPDFTTDTGQYTPTEKIVQGYKIISYQNLFNPKILVENIHLRRGAIYNQKRYLQTLNRFNSLNAWRLVSIDQLPREGTDTVDFAIKLTPAKKYLFNFNIEGSKNWNDFFAAGNLLGLGVNFGLQNRNFARGANQANTNARYGIELNASKNLIQTQQITVGHTITIPRLSPRLNFIPPRLKDNFKTVFNFNLSNTDRLNFFSLSSLNTSWGYEFNWRKNLLAVRIPNIEYSFLKKRKLLDSLILNNASYKYIFNDGLIFSTAASYTLTNSKKNTTSLARFNLETSGLLLGLVPSKFLDSNLYRFVKLDAEFRQTHKIRRTELAWRFFTGAGYELPSTRNRYNLYLPFFRQYYAGGSNSMRAWGLRKLGPGSAIKSFARNIAPDRFGDIQLELNGEYRFFIMELNGVKINSVLFTDMGNVWFLRKNDDFPGGEFRLSKLWKDIAIGAGTGIRIDFGFFLVRLDYAYKIKDPSPDNAAIQNKWLHNWTLLSGQVQLGVNYPF